MSNWTTVFLVNSLRTKQKLKIYKSLQFLGDVCLTQGDEDTAISLFTVALEGFTYMDVHRSRAECMLRLGNISQERNDFATAVELWTTSRPLFERSLQIKHINLIDEKLAKIKEELHHQRASGPSVSPQSTLQFSQGH
jgi:hypothetical protein